MKNFINQAKNICPASKFIIKNGILLSVLLLLCAFFSSALGIQMCSVSVYLFSESIIAGLIFDVVDKRRKG